MLLISTQLSVSTQSLPEWSHDQLLSVIMDAVIISARNTPWFFLLSFWSPFFAGRTISSPNIVRTVRRTIYLISELSDGRTSRSPNIVRTVRRTVLRFLTDFLMRYRLQPDLRCAGCAQTRVHMPTHDTCSLSSIRGPKPHFFFLLVFICGSHRQRWPSHKSTNEASSSEARGWKIFTSATCCCPSFLLFHRRALRFQPVTRKVRRTRRIVPRACRAKRCGPRTQLRRSSSNCPNQGREVKKSPN